MCERIAFADVAEQQADRRPCQHMAGVLGEVRDQQKRAPILKTGASDQLDEGRPRLIKGGQRGRLCVVHQFARKLTGGVVRWQKRRFGRNLCHAGPLSEIMLEIYR